MPILKVYRNGNPFVDISTGEDETVFNGEVIGMNKITSSFTAPNSILFNIGDYIWHNSHVFKIFKDLPTHTKTGTNEHTYSAVFLGREYQLFDKALRHLGNATFSFFGTAAEHLALIIGQANVAAPGWDTGWSVGVVDATEPINIEYDKDSCRTAISKAAEAFRLEYEFKDQVTNMKKQIGGFLHDLTFSYGMDNGLYSMTKKPVEDSNWGTHFFGYGGSTNLPANYRGGLTELTFNPGYVQRNINKYGTIERHKEFPEIIPQRTGGVTAIPSLYSVTDNTLDFNLNDVIVLGEAKIVFVSGDLRNQEFEIDKYDSTTKTIKFNYNEDKSGNKIPNALVKPKIGDQYKFIGIAMPQSYIDNAEARLAVALNTYADENQDPPLQYELGIEEIFMLQKNYQYVINAGDRVKAVEADMGVDVILRVVAISYPVFRPAKITATIADKVSYSLGGQVLKDIDKHEDQIAQTKRSSAEMARINSIRRRELQAAIFDPDGYFDPGNIKPGSIETQMLVAGARSQDFSLDIVFKPNYNANPNSIQWTGGTLTHLSIEDANRTWSIAPGDLVGLTPTTLYYIYARCPKVGTAGTIAIDPAQRRVDADSTYYYFLIGVLHTVINGVRPISVTYGFSELNGRFLTTGRVQSADGLTWFDLDLGEIAGVIKFRSSGGGLQNVSVVDQNATNALANAATADGKAVAAQNAANAAQSAAQTAQNAANAAATAASNSQTSANTANSILSDIANDNILMPAEKQDVLKEWQVIQGERPIIVAQAGSYSITTATYDSAYNSLNSYITPLLANMNVNSAIDGTVFRATFKAYYDAKVALLKAISDRSKQLADAAQTTANGAQTAATGAQNAADAAQLSANTAKTIANNAQSLANAKKRNFVVQPYTPYDVGDFWTNGVDLFRCVTARSSGAFVSTDWQKATVYDSTQVTIDNGVVTGGTVQLGNTGGINAGITGAGGSPTDVRFWAGSSFANRDTAPFRVDQSGKVWMSNAEVSGVLNAGPGSKIGNVMIDAAGKFNLSGLKVEIRPDEFIKVFNGGIVDFRGASEVLIGSAQSPTVGAIWIGTPSDLGGSNPPSYVLAPATTTTLGGVIIGGGLSVDAAGRISVNAESPLTFSTPLVRSGNNVAIVQDANNRFVTDAQINAWFTKSQADSFYAFRDGSNASGTWNININGTAAAANAWNGYDGTGNSNHPMIYTMGYDQATNKWAYRTAAEMQSFLGLGSGAYNDKTKLWSATHADSYYISNSWDGTYWRLTSNHGSAVSVGHSDAATGWGGGNNQYTGAESTVVNNYIMGYSNSGLWQPVASGAVKSWLGLGSFAYRNSISGNEVNTDIASKTYDIGIAQLLRWKNYGNGHVIFDASAGTAPDGTAINDTNSQTNWASSFPTLMGWNGVGTYGVRVDSARNANLLDGFSRDIEANGNTIVARDANGYVYAAYFCMRAPTVDMTNMTDIVTTNGNGFLYRSSAATVRTFLGMDAGGVYHKYNTFNADANTVQENTSNFSYSVNAPWNGYLGHFGANGYGLQLSANYNTGFHMSFRTRNGDNGKWNDWRELLWNGFNEGASLNGRLSISGGIGTSYTNADLQVIGSGRSPNISLHWAGVVASQITVGSDGTVLIKDNPGTGWQNLKAWNITAEGSFYTNSNIGLAWNATGDLLYNHATGQLRFDTPGNVLYLGLTSNGVAKGYIHGATNGDFGLLDTNGNWSLRRSTDTGFWHMSGVVNAEWYRSTGAVGWYNETYAGGIHMNDSTYVRVYNSKAFWVDNTVTAPEIASRSAGFRSESYAGMVGNYDQAGNTDKIIWTIGGSWNTLANMYGLGYDFASVQGFGHSLFMAESGVKRIHFSLTNGNIYSVGKITGNELQAGSRLTIPVTAPSSPVPGDIWIG